MLSNIIKRLWRRKENPYTKSPLRINSDYNDDNRSWEWFHPLSFNSEKKNEENAVKKNPQKEISESGSVKKVRGRMLVKKKPCLSGWQYTGRQESPEFVELEDGRKIYLFSDKQVHDAQQRLYINKKMRTIEKIVDKEETPKHYGVAEPVVGPSDIFQKIKITREAYDKAIVAANEVARIDNINTERTRYTPELFMNLLRHKNAPENLITNVLVAHNQEVSGGSCSRLTEGRSSDVDWWQERDLEYAGWSHSHGDHNTFHSSIDDRQVNNSLNTGFHSLYKSDGVTIHYLRSLVVNARSDEPFGLVGFRYWNLEKKEWDFSSREVPVEIVETDEFHLYYTPEILRNFMELNVNIDKHPVEKEV